MNLHLPSGPSYPFIHFSLKTHLCFERFSGWFFSPPGAFEGLDFGSQRAAQRANVFDAVEDGGEGPVKSAVDMVNAEFCCVFFFQSHHNYCFSSIFLSINSFSIDGYQHEVMEKIE